MKKNVLRVTQAALILAVGFTACKKDELTNREEEAIRLTRTLPDSLNKDVEYTVNLVDASTANFVGKTASDFTGATITAAQGGTVKSMTAGADGMVVFQGMQKGAMSVNIKMDGFATIDYTVDVASGYQGNLIPMIPTTGDSKATIKGTVYLETDLTNSTKEMANAAEIFAIPDVGSSNLGSAINNAGFTAFAYDGLSMSTTTDASGAYTFEVPAAADQINYKLTVSNFQADQKIVMDTKNGADVTGVQTIPTVFGSGVADTYIPTLSGAYVTIGAPDFAISQTAVVTSQIDNPGGVDAFVLSNNGQGYSLASGSSYTMTVDEGGNGAIDADAMFNIVIDGTTERVTESYQSSTGEGYTATTTQNIDFQQTAFAATIQSVGATIFLNITNYGEYLMDPQDAEGNFLFSVKSGATNILKSDITSFSKGAYMSNAWGIYFEIDNTSGDYNALLAGDPVTVTLSTTGKTLAVGNTVLTTGSVSSVAFTTIGKGYAPNSTYDLLLNGGGGTGATAEAYTDADGVMYTGSVTNGGSGYTSAPTVSVLVDASAAGTQAEASVMVNADGTISGISIDNSGAGYSNAPTVTISSQLTVGSGATATAIVSGGQITSITMTNTGSGYEEFANQKFAAQAASFETVGVTNGITKIKDIELGSGKRTIVD